MKRSFLFGLCALILVSCEKKIENIVTEVPALSASAIYRGDSVLSYLKRYGNKNDSIASSYLSRAASETERTDKAIYYNKRAITLYPQPETYRKLGKLLEKAGRYDESFELYNFLSSKSYNNENKTWEHIFGEPEEDVFYEMLVSRFLSQKKLYSYDVYKLEEAGIERSGIRERLIKEERIKADRNSVEWKNTMLLFMNREEIAEYLKKENIFSYLQRSILDSTQVFVIDENTVQNFDYGSNPEFDEFMEGDMGLSEFYSNYLVERQETPKKWYHYNFIRKITVSDSINGIIYSVDTSALACPKNMRHVYHRLVTYDNYGNMIDNKVIAFQAGEVMMTVRFIENKFTVFNFNRAWKKEYNKNDFDNYIVKTEPAGEESYILQNDGTIVPEDIMAN